jgi:hypothetical protein
VPFDPLNDPDEPDVLDELFDPGVLESAAIAFGFVCESPSNLPQF